MGMTILFLFLWTFLTNDSDTTTMNVTVELEDISSGSRLRATSSSSYQPSISTATNPTNLNDATSMDVELEDINSGTGCTASRATSLSSDPPSIRTNPTNLNNTTSMDVEPENVDSGSRAASSSSYQPSISTTNPKNSTNCCTIAITKHPLNTTTLPSPALLIVHSQGLLQFFLFCFVYLCLFIIFRSESWRCRFDSLLFDSYCCHTIDS